MATIDVPLLIGARLSTDPDPETNYGSETTSVYGAGPGDTSRLYFQADVNGYLSAAEILTITAIDLHLVTISLANGGDFEGVLYPLNPASFIDSNESLLSWDFGEDGLPWAVAPAITTGSPGTDDPGMGVLGLSVLKGFTWFNPPGVTIVSWSDILSSVGSPGNLFAGDRYIRMILCQADESVAYADQCVVAMDDNATQSSRPFLRITYTEDVPSSSGRSRGMHRGRRWE